ncbi:hypothetical protein DPMN_062912 [Dreissena polymorpha]|uniref:Uncharacterized protein n=1 Tax=Dreissena polymorpha TaxID=45954 RepID=A0A9D4CAA5_DREPO|nr:hypothetical protein DPMN_062912 [Dreissena polymorpha]
MVLFNNANIRHTIRYPLNVSNINLQDTPFDMPFDMNTCIVCLMFSAVFESSFRIKTAKARRYERPDGVTEEMRPTETDSSHTALDSSRISRIVVRIHEFDIRAPHKGKKGTISNLGGIPKGVQSIREHFKVNESEILPSLRLGITSYDLNEL